MSKVSVFLPVIVDFKRKKQKLRFLIDKTAEQTVSAIMKKLKVKEVCYCLFLSFSLSFVFGRTK